MIYVLTPAQMRAADAAAVASLGEDRLMKTAGVRIAQRVRATIPSGRIVAFAGPGNNGGDAFAACARLARDDYTCIVYAGDSGRVSEARALAEARATGAGVKVRPLPEGFDAACAALDGAALGIDALFGTGARLPMDERYRPLARALDARRLPVLAVDIPSGTDALTGASSDDAVRATMTVTLGAAKPGLLLLPARENVGELWVARIGIDDATLTAQAHDYAALDEAALLDLLPKRGAATDKRGAGAPLVIAGSTQFPGAAILCTLAAARAGAGYVTTATTSGAAATLRMHLVEQVVVTLPDDSTPEEVADDLIDISKRNGAVALGPGLSLDDRTGQIVEAFLAKNDLPIVVDASGLFHLSKRLDILRGKQVVVTPHAGEFARLSGRGTVAPGERVSRVREFVDRTGITTLLKGLDTIVDDGTTVHVNLTGTNALATAGSGDVLTGIVATLLSQGLSPVDAARAGACWHGLAGRLAAQRRRVGVVARDIIDALGDALPYAEPADWVEKRLF